MKDALAGLRPVIEHDSISECDVFIPRDPLNHQKQVAQQRLVRRGALIERLHVLFGDDQNMGGGLGIDVTEGHSMLVFTDYLSRDLLAYDAAKNTIGHGVWPSDLRYRGGSPAAGGEPFA